MSNCTSAEWPSLETRPVPSASLAASTLSTTGILATRARMSRIAALNAGSLAFMVELWISASSCGGLGEVLLERLLRLAGLADELVGLGQLVGADAPIRARPHAPRTRASRRARTSCAARSNLRRERRFLPGVPCATFATPWIDCPRHEASVMTNPASTSPGAAAVGRAGESDGGVPPGSGVGLPTPWLHTVANGVATRIAEHVTVCDDDRMCPSVLIVDDHPGFRARARALLESEGFEVVGEAGDGAIGRALRAAELAPDVVPAGRAAARHRRVRGGVADHRGRRRRSRWCSRRAATAATSARWWRACGARGFIPKAELSGARADRAPGVSGRRLTVAVLGRAGRSPPSPSTSGRGDQRRFTNGGLYIASACRWCGRL